MQFKTARKLIEVAGKEPVDGYKVTSVHETYVELISDDNTFVFIDRTDGKIYEYKNGVLLFAS